MLFVRSSDQHTRWLENVVLVEGEREVKEVEFSAGMISVDAAVGAGEAEAGGGGDCC